MNPPAPPRPGARRGGDSAIPIRVKLRETESVDQMLRRFKKLCEKEGLTKQLKRIAYFEKPSERRRRLKRKAEKREIRRRTEMEVL